MSTANIATVAGALKVISSMRTGKIKIAIAIADAARICTGMFMLPKNGDTKKIPLVRVSTSRNAAICPCNTSKKSSSINFFPTSCKLPYVIRAGKLVKIPVKNSTIRLSIQGPNIKIATNTAIIFGMNAKVCS